MSHFNTFTFSAMVKVTEPKVTISTNIILKMLTLFLRYTRVEVDCVKQAVIITTTTAYLFKKNIVLPFADIRCFDYSYNEVEELHAPYAICRNSLEIFTIKVLMKDGTAYPIAKFYGRGTNHGFDLFDSSLHNYSGRGGDDSRELVDILAEGTGIPVNKRISKPSDYKNLLLCEDCGRATMNTSKRCQYCGGKLC